MKRIILSLAVIALVGIGAIGATRAFFNSTANSTGNTFTAGSLGLKLSNTSATSGFGSAISSSWDFSGMIPGGNPDEDTVWVKNNGSVDGKTLDFALTTNQSIPGFDKQVRITKLTLNGQNLVADSAGSEAKDYVAPTACNATATPGNLVSTVAAATSGDTICVDAGTYNPGTLALNTDGVTLVALNSPDSADKASVEGELDVTASNVTIKGLEITNPNGGYGVSIIGGASGGANSISVLDNNIHNIGSSLSFGSVQAISLQPGSTGGHDYTFSGNKISNVGNLSLAMGSSGSAKGIYVGDSNGTGTITNLTIKNNIISEVQASTAPGTVGRGAYGILLGFGKGGSNTGYIDSAVVSHNTISNLEGLWSHAIGLEGNTPNASLTYNDISNLVDHKGNTDTIGVKIEDNTGTGIVVQHNNFALSMIAGIADAGTSVNAKFNWWGDFTPANHVYGSINTSDSENGPVFGMIGTDNGNGYADLYDLRTQGLTGSLGYGLGSNEVKPLVMGVQLDGPTTDNTFQGEHTTTEMTITLQQ